MGLQNSQEEPSICLGFPKAPVVHGIYNHCLIIMVFLIQQQQTVTMSQGYQDDKSLATYFAEAKWT